MSNNRISRRQLAEIIAKRMDAGEPRQLAKDVAAYLLTEKRSSELLPLMRDVMKIRAEAGTVEATVTSAHELSEAIQSALMKLSASDYPDYEKVVLDFEHDASVVGGVKLETSDMQLDLTVKNRLRSLTRLNPERTKA